MMPKTVRKMRKLMHLPEKMLWCMMTGIQSSNKWKGNPDDRQTHAK
jgi:hypothetical protein